MSTQHARSLLNIDENDLNFDLDELGNIDEFNTNENLQKAPIMQNKKRKSPSPTTTSPFLRPSKNSFIEITKINNNNNKETDKIEKFEIHNQSLFDLFDESNDETPKNDVYSSTQLTQKSQINKTKAIFNSSNQSLIISPNKHENTKLIDKIYAQNLSHDQIWLFAKDSLIVELNKLHLSQNLLEKYSIKNCINKVIVIINHHNPLIIFSYF